MALDAGALGKILWNVLSPVNRKTGAPDPKLTDHMVNYATGFVKMMKASVVAHAIPGSVTAKSAPVGSPIKGGAASAGKIVTLLGPIMSAEIAKGGDPIIAAGSLIEANIIAGYIIGAAKVDFPEGTIFGKSTATSNSPGPLAPDTSKPNGGAGGKISGLSGKALADLVVVGQEGPQKIAFYTALCKYLMDNGKASYPKGSITGTCSNGGTMSAGAAAGGTIS